MGQTAKIQQNVRFKQNVPITTINAIEPNILDP